MEKWKLEKYQDKFKKSVSSKLKNKKKNSKNRKRNEKRNIIMMKENNKWNKYFSLINHEKLTLYKILVFEKDLYKWTRIKYVSFLKHKLLKNKKKAKLLHVISF